MLLLQSWATSWWQQTTSKNNPKAFPIARSNSIDSFGPTVDQALRYVSDRTGIMSFANFPVIWFFGMRNNLALWLTGWDFGTYNNFHRWTARLATLQAIIHSIGYTIIAIRCKLP